MSESEIAKLYENLFLVDEDVVVHEMAEEVKVDEAKDVEMCLVGKVLAGKKVNREAFKRLIEQIWNPFSHNSLIVLEKPVGTGNISRLGFNMADFWIQIHDILILCMNRRTAKWLAEQIGEVVEIPSESRECWGKFMRVKVKIDISKPLKWWLRLKLGKVEEVTRVSLKYERLPEFYFACGRIGHGIKGCVDEEARKAALEGSPNKFGSWLKATISTRSKPRGNVQAYESSSDMTRSIEASCETEEDRSVSLRSGSMTSYKEAPVKAVVAPQVSPSVTSQQTLPPKGGLGAPQTSVICIDGPEVRIEGSSSDLGLLVVNLSPAQEGVSSVQPMEAEPFQSLLTPKKKIAKRWKRAAKEVKNVGSSGGLLLLWKDNSDVSVLSFSLGHIDARVCSEDDFCWQFSGFYGDPISSRRKLSWALLRRLREVDNLPWVCDGDFNDILSMTEKEGGSAKSFSDMYNFRQTIDDCNLIDLGFTRPKYTWNNKRDGSNNIQERLDKFLANDLWRNNFRDRNSKVFHAKATARKKKIFISNLMDSEGNPHDTEARKAWSGNIFNSLIFDHRHHLVQDVFHSLASHFNSDVLSLVCMLA
ncbi:hypothetical protein EZV62_022204 [Acer yangbiense]|uniref:Zinc knuckle CX2CX4HX4C domain-containing protein n=1 Tax=Acer yangbiense TaxID=1000413 RepID=A0A5C7H981_9ROSI|nr:hypothetical protein EZV62_022204 [Acer yangbiense]